MRVLVSGSTGLIGRALVVALEAAGDVVVPLVRRSSPPPAIAWDAMNADTVSGFDAVVHLAGEPVAAGRWTAARKRSILDSRVEGTSRLAHALAAAERPPGVFVCASGVNFYGDRGDDEVDESSPRGNGFLADVCVAWEGAAAPLEGMSRIVHLRIAMVLSAEGGPLATLLPPFRLGLGGPVGGGRAYVSWITLGDTVRAISHVLRDSALAGAVNVVAPEPVTNRAFTAALARALRRPAIVPVPGWAVRLAYGQMATETVLNSVRAVPMRLRASGFLFEQGEVEGAMRAVVGTIPV